MIKPLVIVEGVYQDEEWCFDGSFYGICAVGLRKVFDYPKGLRKATFSIFSKNPKTVDAEPLEFRQGSCACCPSEDDIYSFTASSKGLGIDDQVDIENFPTRAQETLIKNGVGKYWVIMDYDTEDIILSCPRCEEDFSDEEAESLLNAYRP